MLQFKCGCVLIPASAIYHLTCQLRTQASLGLAVATLMSSGHAIWPSLSAYDERGLWQMLHNVCSFIDTM